MKRIVLGVIFGLLLLTSRDAVAQTMSFGTFHGYITGHLGGTLGGKVDDPRVTGGVSVSVQETTGWGAELDFGRSSDVDINGGRFDITTYMVNMMFVNPDKKLRPFFEVGGGIHQVDGCSCNHEARTFDFGVNSGAGIFLLANDMFGMRADARYFWSFGDHPDLGRPENLSHWRLSVGFTYLWQMAP